MKLAGFEYNLEHKALEIYISGCKGPYCAGCHNPDLWDFTLGWDIDEEILLNINTRTHEDMIEYVWILGGEPQDQKMEELNLLLSYIDKPVVLFTRYTDVDKGLDISLIDYIKFGPYDCLGEQYVEPVLGITLASKNQYVKKI